MRAIFPPPAGGGQFLYGWGKTSSRQTGSCKTRPRRSALVSGRQPPKVGKADPPEKSRGGGQMAHRRGSRHPRAGQARGRRNPLGAMKWVCARIIPRAVPKKTWCHSSDPRRRPPLWVRPDLRLHQPRQAGLGGAHGQAQYSAPHCPFFQSLRMYPE